MVIFLNLDGSGEIVTPQRIYQGSNNVTEVTVIAPFATDTRLEIGFILPNGLYWTNSDGARYVPMNFVQKDYEGNVSAWNFVLPFSVTEQVGDVKIAINATSLTGNATLTSSTTSYLCEFTVEESVLPNKPSPPDQSVYDYLSMYLARLDGRTANVPNLVASIQKTSGNSFTYTDNKGLVSEEITLGVVDYNPTYVGAASVVKIPVTAWQEVYSGTTVTGYTVTVSAAQHGQMQDGVTPNDLWLSFDVAASGGTSGVYQGYSINAAGDITINVTQKVAMTVRVWNGKGLVDVTARQDIVAETTRAEAAEAALQTNINAEQTRAEGEERHLQSQIDEIVQSGVDLTAREQIAAETARAEAAEDTLQANIDDEAQRAEAAEDELNSQIETIDSYISPGTSASNQLANQASVNSSINNMAAFYITSTADGAAFPTRESLLNATTYYYGGQVRTPTQNDYAIVLADESQPKGVDGSYPTTRYSYQGTEWSFQYVVNNTSLTQAQVDAINSGITKTIVDQLTKGNVLSVNGKVGAVTLTAEDVGALSENGGTVDGDIEMNGNIKFPTLPPLNSAPTYFITFNNNLAANGIAYTRLTNMPFMEKAGGTFSGAITTAADGNGFISHADEFNFCSNMTTAGNFISFNYRGAPSGKSINYYIFYNGTGDGILADIKAGALYDNDKRVYSSNNPPAKYAIERNFVYNGSSQSFTQGTVYNLSAVGLFGVVSHIGGVLKIGSLIGLVINTTQFIALTNASVSSSTSGTLYYYTIG